MNFFKFLIHLFKKTKLRDTHGPRTELGRQPSLKAKNISFSSSTNI